MSDEFKDSDWLFRRAPWVLEDVDASGECVYMRNLLDASYFL